jgi:hypothetical protein
MIAPVAIPPQPHHPFLTPAVKIVESNGVWPQVHGRNIASVTQTASGEVS